MRNLKRALSLGLTAAMISGLMVMGSSAAGYADVTSENNQEAIEVLQAVGIMVGDENGNFNPDQNVTRNEMAVIMANLMEYNVASYKDTSPFTDVPSWAEPYVAACWTNGITAGTSATTYGGSNDVTTAQAALMLMKALGYFQYSTDFGADWQLSTVRQGNAIDLFNGVDSGVEQAMTRNDVAQLVLNTLRSGTVQAETNGSLTVGNVTIATDVKYNYVTSNQTYATAIDDARSTSNTTDANRSIVELGEQLYMGDLKLNDNSDDDFMRPARTWSYDGKEIGTYAKRELMVESYTTGVTGKDMYDLLSSATIRDNELFNYVDGEDGTIKASQLVRSNDDDLDGTGDGVLTEVYLDQDADEITIVSISTWLAKATADYNESKEYAPLTVYTGVDQTATYNVDVDEVASVADVAEDEFYQVNITYKNNTRGEVVAVSPVEVLADSTVTKYSASDKGDGTGQVTKLTTGGTEYKRNAMAYYDEDVLDTYDDGLLTDSTYNVYLDQYGYFLGVDLYDGAKNYVFITGYDRPTSNLSVKTADAAAIFLDGTMKKIEVNVKDTNENIADAPTTYGQDDYFTQWTDNGGGQYALNRWYTYTVDQNGVYTLKPAVRMTATDYTVDTTINTSNLNVRDNKLDAGTRVYGEDASVFLTVDLDEVDTTLPAKKAITEVTGVYTGVQEVEIEIDRGTAIEEAEVYTVYDSDYFIIGAVVVGEAQGNNANIAYLIDGAKSESYDGTYYYWEFECVMDGQVQTLTAKSKYLDTIRALRHDKDNDDGIVELRFDGDNYVVDVKGVDDIYGNTEYTDASKETKDYDVYDVTKADQLTLQGRTLYVTSNQADMGLALAKDAKAVVIQDENNKTDVKTEFSSVSAAIAHLADANTALAGIQYDGRIIAALDNTGAATWVIFDSNTKLVTGAQQGGVVTPGVTVTIGAANAITITTTDNELKNANEALNAISAFLTNQGLSVGTPYLAGGVWQIPTFYDLGNGIKIPAQTYTFSYPSGLTQEVTYYLNGDYANPQTATAGDYLSSVLVSKGELVDINGVKTDISTLTTTKVESGRNYVVYSTVTNDAGKTLTGVVGTKVMDTKADFLTGNYTSAGEKISDVKFGTTDKTVSDGYYKVDIDGAVSYQKPGTVTVVADHVLVNDVLTAKADVKVVDKDLEIKDGYYERTFTADVDALLNTTVGDLKVVSGKAVIQDGKIYGADDAKIEVVVTTAQPGFIAGGTSCTLTGSTGVVIDSNYVSNAAITGDDTNELTFTAGSTCYGTATVTITLTGGVTNYTLTAANS